MQVVTSGFMSEICGKIYLQKHDALTHQYEECLKKKAAKEATHRREEPVFGPQPTYETSPATLSDRDSADQDDI